MAVAIGLGAGARTRREWLALVVAGSLPDVDLIFRFVDADGMRWHHGPTHSLVGTVLLGALAARAFGVRAWPCVLACAAHLPLDWSTGVVDAPREFGIELLWPFSTERFLDTSPFFGAYRLDQPGFLLNVLRWEAVPILGEEVGVVALALVLGGLVRTLRARRAARA